ncbi:Methyl-CpG-binding domain-containing protein 9 [Vitis vinifera]|uniref:Methyl-CpG-binding domain-containing protein 9 n=1 Tax=Vitis vinifera TaxID=29760 RepID=A0A438HNR6_VITVI|nr:Methyl-CpG-binding domain-containing protein 9 [Vitis vinifera]
MEYNWNANIEIFGRRGPAPGVRLGGVLGDSLTRVAGMQADALLFAEARKQGFVSLEREDDIFTIEEKGSDATGDHDRIVVNDGSILQWAHVLEPVRELPTNGEIKIRKCIYEALEKVQRSMRRIRDIMYGPLSDDSEDGDHNPNAPEIDEQVNQESSSSDFTSDSEDFTATLDRRNFSDDEDSLDGQRRFDVGEEKFLGSDSFLGNERSNSTGGGAGIAISKNSGVFSIELSYLETSRIMLADEDSDSCQKPHDHVFTMGHPTVMTCSNDEMTTEDAKVAGVKASNFLWSLILFCGELSIRYFTLCSKFPFCLHIPLLRAGIHAPSSKIPSNFHAVEDVAGEDLDGSIQVFKASFAACDRLLEEPQKLSKTINQTIDSSDFISKLNDARVVMFHVILPESNCARELHGTIFCKF